MLAIVTAGHGAAPELPRLRGVANIKCSPAFQTSNTKYSILFCNRREHFNMRQYHISTSVVDAAYCRHPVESQLSILATSGQQQLVQQQAESHVPQ